MKISVTGHRPKKLNNAYDIRNPINIAIGREMRAYILKEAGYQPETKTFSYADEIWLISALALGVDTIWALVALKLAKDFPGKFKLECALPCKEHWSKWMNDSITICKNIIEKADKVTLVTDSTYTYHCMDTCDEYMVHQATKVFAVWDGTPSGTAKCVQRVKEQGKLVHVFNPTPLLSSPV